MSRKHGFGTIWDSSSSKQFFSLHWIRCRARLRLPKHSNIVYLQPQRDFSITQDITIQKKTSRCLKYHVSPNCWSSFHFPLLMGCAPWFYQALLWKSPCSPIFSSSMLVLSHFVRQNLSFCQLHHAVSMICLPCRPDNVVTSTNPKHYWTVWGSGPERPCVMVHLESFAPGNS